MLFHRKIIKRLRIMLRVKKSDKHTDARPDRSVGTKQQVWTEANELLKQRLQSIAALPMTLPLPIRDPYPDSKGCNWYMQWDEHAPRHKAVVMEVVEEMRAKWNLE
jgi:hypothetical protein